jgi:sulfate transport system substrate-binding protein
MTPSINRVARFATLAIAATLPLSSLPATSGAATITDNVNVVGYSVVGPAFKSLEASFQATPAGAGVGFTNSFGASDTQTQNVEAGQSADLVNLSYQPNISSLVTVGKVPAPWTTQELTYGRVNTALTGRAAQTTYPTPGVVTDSVVVFVVRKGNPLKITNWSNLTAKGIQIVTPNPLTSGSARWNLLAAYSSQLQIGKTAAQARAYLKLFIAHTVAQPTSGSAAMAAFVGGTGNVLVDYEDDAKAAVAAGDQIQVVTPPQSLLIENPVALTNTGLTNPGAKAFYRYLFSAAGQGIFASLGYRSVLTTIWKATSASFVKFTAPNSLWSVTNLSSQGWKSVNSTFFWPTVVFASGSTTNTTRGLVTYLERFAGTAS